MNTDFRVKVGFFRHHKTRLLKKRLGGDGVLALLQLWEYASEFKPDGDLSEMTDEQIEVAVGWEGPKSLVGTLKDKDINFLDGDEGSYSLHNWHEHNPWISESEIRSDFGRLGRLCRDNPEIGAQLKAAGRIGISAEEYRLYHRASTLEGGLQVASSTLEGGLQVAASIGLLLAPAPTPTPAPTPAPKLKQTEVVSVRVSARAKQDAPNGAHSRARKTPMPENFGISDTVQRWANEHQYGELDLYLEAFRDKVRANGYCYVDWDAAFMEAIRSDWAGLRCTGGNGSARAGPTDKGQQILEEAKRLRQQQRLPERVVQGEVVKRG